MWDRNRAYRFIVLMGFVSLLSDFTYEGAKGIIGPYLASLGATAFAISLISGLSELAGYWIRLLSGLLSDRLRSYWFFTLFGYALNLLSVPLLGFAKSWHVAGFLVFLERAGKGLRTPSRDTLLSGATSLVGHGKGFGLHEFLDQLGAVLGPLVVGSLLLLGFGYKYAFFMLFFPTMLALILLMVAKKSYPLKVEQRATDPAGMGFSKGFYLYLFASSFVALGFLQFPLVGFHLSEVFSLQGWQVAFLFALAMLVDAFSAIIFGLLYDRIGFSSLMLGLSFGLLAPALLFLWSKPVIAVVLWGISLGVQESIMRSAIADLSPKDLRGKAYGVFHFFFGLSAFLGGALMGLLYELSPKYLVIYSLVLHLLALGFMLRLR